MLVGPMQAASYTDVRLIPLNPDFHKPMLRKGPSKCARFHQDENRLNLGVAYLEKWP